MELYHYTKIENLYYIVKSQGLHFWARHYKLFANGEYKWIKPLILPLIKEQCERKQKDFAYDNDTMNPCIVSFCKNGTSKKMWHNYGNKDYGIQLVLDKHLISEQSNREGAIDVLQKCMYLNRNTDKSKKRILRNYLMTEHKLMRMTVHDYQMELSLIAYSVKQYKYRNEQEVRYIRSYPIVAIVRYNNGVPIVYDNPIPTNNPLEATENEFVTFSKTTLKEVVLGKRVSKNQKQEIEKYLIETGYNHVRVRYRN